MILNKKEELLMNAAKIIHEEGIQKLTMAYLASQSGITKGGVLYHFDNKANLLQQMSNMALQNFENRWHDYAKTLEGDGIFTRAYAYATLDFFRDPETALLPAVFITSLEDQASLSAWKKTSAHWETQFQQDTGDADANLSLRLICDGIWFMILYGSSSALNEQIEVLVLEHCKQIEKR